MAKYAVHTDANVGLTKADVDTVMAAMKQIEAKTCIKFNLVKPVKGQPWLFVSRESRASDMVCQLNYAKSNLVGKDIEGLWDIYKRLGYNDGCFPGAYAFYGSSSPQNFVISKTTLSSAYQSDIGLVVHEVLHNLATLRKGKMPQNILILNGKTLMMEEKDNMKLVLLQTIDLAVNIMTTVLPTTACQSCTTGTHTLSLMLQDKVVARP